MTTPQHPTLAPRAQTFTPHINTAPATLDACFTELSRLGDLRETGRIPDAQYYATDAKLTRRLLELQAADPERLMTDAEVAILVRLPEAPEFPDGEFGAPFTEPAFEPYIPADAAEALDDAAAAEAEADAELRFGGLLQDPDAQAEELNAALSDWRRVRGYVYEEVD